MSSFNLIQYFFDLRSKFGEEVTDVPEILNNSQIQSLNGWRAIAILYVLIAHYNGRFQNHFLEKFFGYGFYGVHVFFVISGFLITTLLLKEKIARKTISLKKFYIRRAFRILPVVYLYIATILVLKYHYGLDIQFLQVFAVLFFVKNLDATIVPFSWFCQHFWSLSVEEQFYILFPVFVKKNLNLFVLILLVIIVANPLLAYYSDHLKIENIAFHVFVSLFIHLSSIGFGSLLSVLLFKGMIPLNMFRKYPDILVFITFLLSVLFFNKIIPVPMSGTITYFGAVLI